MYYLLNSLENIDYTESDDESDNKAQSVNIVPITENDSKNTSKGIEISAIDSAKSNQTPLNDKKNVFHYPIAKFNLNKRKKYITEKNMSHRDKLISCIDDISEQEIATLQSYIQEYNLHNKHKIKDEVLHSLQSILNEMVDELTKTTTADVEFIPEFKSDVDRDAYNALITKKAELTLQLQEIEYYLTHIDEFGKCTNCTSLVYDIIILYIRK